MPRPALEIPEEVRRRVLLQGAEGASWLAGVAASVGELERAWDLAAGPTLPGGSGSIVVEATTNDGRAAVLKLPLPWLDPSRRQLRAMLAAAGRGHATVLRHDETRGAMLLERLGPRLSTLGLGIDAQMDALCATLKQAWIRPADAAPFLSGDRKAAELAAFIERTWRATGEPCSRRVIDAALAFAALRESAFDPDRAVLAHGDAHAENLLVAGDGFRFVDPEGLFIEPAYDLSVPMREWSADLLDGDPLRRGLDRCHRLAALTNLDPEPVWQWGLIERVATGLHLLELGWPAEARETLEVAEAWARR